MSPGASPGSGAARGGARGGNFNELDDRDDQEEQPPIVAEINITPLTDIFLVLLIIFMVTTSVASRVGVDVQLPSARSGVATPLSAPGATAEDEKPEGAIITLLAEGELRVNGERIAPGDFALLEKKLRAAFLKTSSRLVVLEGDRRALLGSAIEVMDRARVAGAERFAIATQPD
jgi:biopolymer transport protein ExbD